MSTAVADLTGLTDDQVAVHRIDPAEVALLIGGPPVPGRFAASKQSRAEGATAKAENASPAEAGKTPSPVPLWRASVLCASVRRETCLSEQLCAPQRDFLKIPWGGSGVDAERGPRLSKVR